MKNPFRRKYAMAKVLSTISYCLLYCSAIPAIILFLGVSMPYAEVVSAIISVLYTASVIITSILLRYAEEHRRADLIDNSFGTKYAECRTEGYYSNDNHLFGIAKMAVNNFESCFFTRRILRHNLPIKCIIAVIIGTVTLIAATTGANNTICVFLQASLPITLIVDLVNFLFLNSFIHKIEDRYRSIYCSANQEPAELIKNVIEYESIMSWANILLSEKTYNKLNHKLTLEWEQLKEEYNLTA